MSTPNDNKRQQLISKLKGMSGTGNRLDP